ncbi:MAG: hypothetical protein KHW59_06200 [Clostridiales bacterium]|nr:hypothetical protein [Clostridiales bacterium]
MKINEGMFAIKLYEMEQQYGRIQSRLRLCQQEDHPKIRQELQKAIDEYKETEFLLQKNIEGCRSQAVAALARAQLEYYRTVRTISERELPDYLHSEAGTLSEDKAEAAALYGEYAIDFAIQSARYALIAALKAMDLQMNAEEQKEGNPNE